MWNYKICFTCKINRENSRKKDREKINSNERRKRWFIFEETSRNNNKKKNVKVIWNIIEENLRM